MLSRSRSGSIRTSQTKDNARFTDVVIHLPKKARRTLLLTILFLLTLVFVGYSSRSKTVLPHFFSIRDDKNSTNRWQTHRKQLVSWANDSENKFAFSQIPFAEQAFFDSQSNLLGTLSFSPTHEFQRQPYVSNGYIGSRIPNLGHGFAMDNAPGNNTSNGWPLFNPRFAGAFVSGFYDLQQNTTGTNFPWLLQYGGESVISAIPQWTSLSLSAEGKTLDPNLTKSDWGSIDEYSQTLSLNDGIVKTLFLWLGSLYIQYEVAANRAFPSVGTVSVYITNPSDKAMNVSVVNDLDFSTTTRLTLLNQTVHADGISQVYSPKGVSDAFGATYSYLRYAKQIEQSVEQGLTDQRVYQNVTLLVPSHSEVVISKIVGISTSDLDPNVYDSQEKVLEKAMSDSLLHSNEELMAAHSDEWLSLLGASLAATFPDDPLLTLTTRASIYHLLANTRSNAEGLTAALGVTGLSSDSYGGMVFWDTDLWMLSALLPYAPSHSRSLVNYRLFTHDQAKQNLFSPLNTLDITDGAAYPWTSGRYGNCTATGPCFDYEYHLNAAIVFSAWKMYLSGAVGDEYLNEIAFPIISDAALFFSQYAQYNDTLQKYTTKNLTDPDEYANHVDNGAYTNAAIVSTMNIAQAIYSHLGKNQPAVLAKVAEAMYIPRSGDDNNIILEFSGMPASVEVKQADVVMLTYPLEYGLDELMAEENMRYYSMKQASFGPAMTWPIFSAVSSVVSEVGCSSQSYLVKAAKPFLRGPFAQFSEQNNDDYATNGGTHPAFPFLTASGGFLQAVHSLLGLKFDYELKDDKVIRFLRVNPARLSNLPQGVFLDGIKYMNLTLAMNLTDNALEVTNHGPENNTMTMNSTLHIKTDERLGANDYYVGAGQKMNLPIFMIAASSNNSLTECRNSIFANITAGVAGDVLDLINDGDNSTYWQAETANPSKILVDLLQNKTLRNGLINWGEMPPAYVKIYSTTASFNMDSHYDLLGAVLAGVSFSGAGSYMMNQTQAFEEAFSMNITMTQPYNQTEHEKVILTTSSNVTTVNFKESPTTRFVLVEFAGLLSPSENGAKVYDLNFT